MFNVPTKKIGLISPKSFKPKSLTWLDNHFELIEVTDEERVNVEINTFTLPRQKVVMLERSKRLASLLESKGIQTILVNYSSLTKPIGFS